jgi:hypothetical protein
LTLNDLSTTQKPYSIHPLFIEMTESAQVCVVRAYIDMIDSGDIDGGLAHLTDDFVYIVEPKPTAAAYGSGFSKEGYKSFYETFMKDIAGMKVTISLRHVFHLSSSFPIPQTTVSDVSESPGKVSIRVRYRHSAH